MPYELPEPLVRLAGTARTDAMRPFADLDPEVQERVRDLVNIADAQMVTMKLATGPNQREAYDRAQTCMNEVDILWPPDENEIAARIDEYQEARDRERVHANAKSVLASISLRTLDPRYARLADHVAAFAKDQLAPYWPSLPRVKLFFPDGRNGYYSKSSDPLSIHIATGLSDADLVRTVCHEVAHWAYHHDANPITEEAHEATARYEEERLFAEYTSRYGRGAGAHWESL